ncbi:MAG: bifunctional acetate--CoA ligase family protein/GNAT family N-acetyltransferase [Rhodospirillaceae bacterium]|nr:bifunctional acetate--CoA ligase family protein/GNAT family N-acetyltransferase [Rhodospirillaceae bacterium]
MSVRNLDYLFKPKSIAVIGASKRPQSVGAVLSHNLFNAGFDGPVMPVNPHEQSIEATLCYPSIADLPITPDLAVVVTPPKSVPGVIAELGERGTKGVIVVTAGFGEGEDDGGKALIQQALDIAKPHLMRIIGPNCLGIMVPGHGVNASFVHINPLPGNIAFLTQSGAIATSVVDWATYRGIGFSHMVSLGNMADVDFGDMLDYLAADPNTRAILMYIESVTEARKFMSAGRAAARIKPVIVLKAGRNEAAAKAATSHTGALAGSDAVYDAAIRRAGMLRVFTMVQLFDAVETLATGMRIKGERLSILTNGGGVGVLATESLIDAGGTLADIAPETIEKLNAVLPPTWSKGNPVDIIGDAPGSRYSAALEGLLEDPNTDAVLVLNCPQAIADSVEAADAVVETLSKRRAAPVLTNWLGEGAAADARKLFAKHRIPTYETPGQAATAFMHLVDYKRNQELLLQTPPSVAELFDPDVDRARAVIHKALDEGREVLTEPEAKNVLDAYAIPVVRTLVAANPEAAAKCAEEIGKPVALKILSPDITHKSDKGGVRLNLGTPDEVHWAAARMLANLTALEPDARIEGFTVQEMAKMPGARELILGIAEDPIFGAVLLFGRGGTQVEVVQDKVIALPPLNMVLAREMMTRTRIYKEMQAYRNVKAVDLDAVALTMIKLSQMVTDLTEVEELDINPLFASDAGVLALDARIKVRPPLAKGSPRRTAIRPVPHWLKKTETIEDGRQFLLRPIVPEDLPLIQEMVSRCTTEDTRLRFFAPLKELPMSAAQRLTQIDYDREMAMVAVGKEDGEARIFGVVRITADPDNERAEYAVMVRSDMKGNGLGWKLMQEILDYARGRGIREVFGEVLRENRTMLKMCSELGFHQAIHPDEPRMVDVTVDLTKPLAPPA